MRRYRTITSEDTSVSEQHLPGHEPERSSMHDPAGLSQEFRSPKRETSNTSAKDHHYDRPQTQRSDESNRISSNQSLKFNAAKRLYDDSEAESSRILPLLESHSSSSEESEDTDNQSSVTPSVYRESAAEAQDTRSRSPTSHVPLPNIDIYASAISRTLSLTQRDSVVQSPLRPAVGKSAPAIPELTTAAAHGIPQGLFGPSSEEVSRKSGTSSSLSMTRHESDDTRTSQDRGSEHIKPNFNDEAVVSGEIPDVEICFESGEGLKGFPDHPSNGGQDASTEERVHSVPNIMLDEQARKRTARKLLAKKSVGEGNISPRSSRAPTELSHISELTFKVASTRSTRDITKQEYTIRLRDSQVKRYYDWASEDDSSMRVEADGVPRSPIAKTVHRRRPPGDLLQAAYVELWDWARALQEEHLKQEIAYDVLQKEVRPLRSVPKTPDFMYEDPSAGLFGIRFENRKLQNENANLQKENASLRSRLKRSRRFTDDETLLRNRSTISRNYSKAWSDDGKSMPSHDEEAERLANLQRNIRDRQNSLQRDIHDRIEEVEMLKLQTASLHKQLQRETRDRKEEVETLISQTANLHQQRLSLIEHLSKAQRENETLQQLQGDNIEEMTRIRGRNEELLRLAHLDKGEALGYVQKKMVMARTDNDRLRSQQQIALKTLRSVRDAALEFELSQEDQQEHIQQRFEHMRVQQAREQRQGQSSRHTSLASTDTMENLRRLRLREAQTEVPLSTEKFENSSTSTRSSHPKVSELIAKASGKIKKSKPGPINSNVKRHRNLPEAYRSPAPEGYYPRPNLRVINTGSEPNSTSDANTQDSAVSITEQQESSEELSPSTPGHFAWRDSIALLNKAVGPEGLSPIFDSLRGWAMNFESRARVLFDVQSLNREGHSRIFHRDDIVQVFTLPLNAFYAVKAADDQFLSIYLLPQSALNIVCPHDFAYEQPCAIVDDYDASEDGLPWISLDRRKEPWLSVVYRAHYGSLYDSNGNDLGGWSCIMLADGSRHGCVPSEILNPIPHDLIPEHKLKQCHCLEPQPYTGIGIVLRDCMDLHYTFKLIEHDVLQIAHRDSSGRWLCIRHRRTGKQGFVDALNLREERRPWIHQSKSPVHDVTPRFLQFPDAAWIEGDHIDQEAIWNLRRMPRQPVQYSEGLKRAWEQNLMGTNPNFKKWDEIFVSPSDKQICTNWLDGPPIGNFYVEVADFDKLHQPWKSVLAVNPVGPINGRSRARSRSLLVLNTRERDFRRFDGSKDEFLIERSCHDGYKALIPVADGEVSDRGYESDPITTRAKSRKRKYVFDMDGMVIQPSKAGRELTLHNVDVDATAPYFLKTNIRPTWFGSRSRRGYLDNTGLKVMDLKARGRNNTITEGALEIQGSVLSPARFNPYICSPLELIAKWKDEALDVVYRLSDDWDPGTNLTSASPPEYVEILELIDSVEEGDDPLLVRAVYKDPTTWNPPVSSSFLVQSDDLEWSQPLVRTAVLEDLATDSRIEVELLRRDPGGSPVIWQCLIGYYEVFCLSSCFASSTTNELRVLGDLYSRFQAISQFPSLPYHVWDFYFHIADDPPASELRPPYLPVSIGDVLRVLGPGPPGYKICADSRDPDDSGLVRESIIGSNTSYLLSYAIEEDLGLGGSNSVIVLKTVGEYVQVCLPDQRLCWFHRLALPLNIDEAEAIALDQLILVGRLKKDLFINSEDAHSTQSLKALETIPVNQSSGLASSFVTQIESSLDRKGESLTSSSQPDTLPSIPNPSRSLNKLETPGTNYGMSDSSENSKAMGDIMSQNADVEEPITRTSASTNQYSESSIGTLDQQTDRLARSLPPINDSSQGHIESGEDEFIALRDHNESLQAQRNPAAPARFIKAHGTRPSYDPIVNGTVAESADAVDLSEHRFSFITEFEVKDWIDDRVNQIAPTVAAKPSAVVPVHLSQNSSSSNSTDYSSVFSSASPASSQSSVSEDIAVRNRPHSLYSTDTSFSENEGIGHGPHTSITQDTSDTSLSETDEIRRRPSTPITSDTTSYPEPSSSPDTASSSDMTPVSLLGPGISLANGIPLYQRNFAGPSEKVSLNSYASPPVTVPYFRSEVDPVIPHQTHMPSPLGRQDFLPSSRPVQGAHSPMPTERLIQAWPHPLAPASHHTKFDKPSIQPPAPDKRLADIYLQKTKSPQVSFGAPPSNHTHAKPLPRSSRSSDGQTRLASNASISDESYSGTTICNFCADASSKLGSPSKATDGPWSDIISLALAHPDAQELLVMYMDAHCPSMTPPNIDEILGLYMKTKKTTGTRSWKSVGSSGPTSRGSKSSSSSSCRRLSSREKLQARKWARIRAWARVAQAQKSPNQQEFFDAVSHRSSDRSNTDSHRSRSSYVTAAESICEENHYNLTPSVIGMLVAAVGIALWMFYAAYCARHKWLWSNGVNFSHARSLVTERRNWQSGGGWEWVIGGVALRWRG